MWWCFSSSDSEELEELDDELEELELLEEEELELDDSTFLWALFFKCFLACFLWWCFSSSESEELEELLEELEELELDELLDEELELDSTFL